MTKVSNLLRKKFADGVLCSVCGGASDTGTGHQYGCVNARYDVTIADHPDLVELDEWIEGWYGNDS